MEKVSIKPYFSTVIHNSNLVELRQGVWNSLSHMLHDENEEGILSKIILNLNYPIDPAEIAESLGLKRSKIESVLDYLNMLGVLQTKNESFIDQYIDRVAPTLKRPGKLQYELSTPVVLIGDQQINNKISHMIDESLTVETHRSDVLWELIKKSDDDWMFDAIEQEKFIDQFVSWQDKFIVLSLRHIHPVIASKVNRIARILNVPWIHLALDGPFIFIGPTFDGKNGACYDCFETRVSMNLRENESYQKYKKLLFLQQVHPSQNDPLFNVTSNVLATHATLEIFNQLATRSGFTKQKLLSIFLPTMEFSYHDFLKFPSCRTCGSVLHRDDTQMYFDFQNLGGEMRS